MKTTFRSALLATVLVLVSSGAHAEKEFDINDCIIDGLKGVQSDIAAKMVKDACERKEKERPDWKADQYRKQLGKVVDSGTIEIVELFTNAGPGHHGLKVRNVDNTDTVTFIRIKVTPAPIAGKGCDYQQTKFEPFRVTIPAGTEATLHYPSRGGEESCVSLVTVFAREAESTDKTTATPVRALTKDPMLIKR